MNAALKTELGLLRGAHQVEMLVFMDNFRHGRCACYLKQGYGCIDQTIHAHVRISNQRLLNEINASYRKACSDAEVRLG